MELHHPIMSKLWNLGGQTKRKIKDSFNLIYSIIVQVEHTLLQPLYFFPSFGPASVAPQNANYWVVVLHTQNRGYMDTRLCSSIWLVSYRIIP